MITVYCDFESLLPVQPGDRTLVVDKPEDYVPARQRLRSALDDPDHEYSLYLHNKPIFEVWFSDLRDYGDKTVKWEQVRLLDRFAQRFGFPAPAEINEQAIKSLALLDLAVPIGGSVADSTGWLLSSLLGKAWESALPYDGHLADLSVWCAESDPLPTPLIPLIRARLKQWSDADKRYQVFIERGLVEAGEGILLRWALRSYPSDFALRQTVSAFPQIDCSRYADACATVLERHSGVLEAFWGKWLAENPKSELGQALPLMSGLAIPELRALVALAQRAPENLASEHVTMAQERFAALPQAKTELAEIATLVPPLIPAEPNQDQSWDTAEWLAWATRSYLPYFKWLVRNRRQRGKQTQLGTVFATWLVGAYPDLIFLPKAPTVINIKARISERLAPRPDAVALWIIVDGLTWWQTERLAEMLVERGIGIAATTPTLAALPSITDISKRAEARGSLERAPDIRLISQVLQQSAPLAGRAIHVYRQHTELDEALQSGLGSGVHVLFYNDLDHHSHGTNSIADEVIEGHLRQVAKLMQMGFKRCAAQGVDVLGFISSDHGSTLLPDAARTLQPPRFAKILDEGEPGESGQTTTGDRRTRSCVFPDLPDPSFLQPYEKDWHILRGEMYSLPGNYLIPKGYDAVTRNSNTWTHGGATPEETVTALMELVPAMLKVLPPEIIIDVRLLSKATAPLVATITNPNQFPLQDVRLTVSNTQAPHDTDRIGSFDEETANIIALPAVSQGRSQTLYWTLACQVGGERKQYSGQVEVEVRRLMAQDDDIFNI